MVAVAASGLQGPCRQICGCDQGSGIQNQKNIILETVLPNTQFAKLLPNISCQPPLPIEIK